MYIFDINYYITSTLNSNVISCPNVLPLYYSLTKEDVVMGMLKKFEMAKEDETAQEKWKMARKLKRQVLYGITLLNTICLCFLT